MSLETALGHCALSTVQAGLACGFAAETGGLGAMLCATAVGDAALDCFEAGKEAAEAYEKNFPDQLPEPPPATETPPEMCIDPAASNDASWNEFYVTGAVYLSRNATEAQLSTLGFPGRLLTLLHAGTALQITPDSPSTSPEQARGAFLQLCTDWDYWTSKVESLKFTDLDNARLFATALNRAKKFAKLYPVFQAMKV